MSKNKNIIYNLLGVASLGVLSYSAYNLFKLYNKNKGGAEQKSSVGGLKTISITLTNNTNQTQVINLFDSRSGTTNPNVGVSANLNLFNAELSTMPKKIIKAEFRNINTVVPPAPLPPAAPAAPAAPAPLPAPIAQNNQSEAPFQMECKDASGLSSNTPYTPLISTGQFQGGITTVNFNGQILDGTCFMKYTMFPNSKITIVVYYEDFPLSGLLGSKTKKKNKEKKEDKSSDTSKSTSYSDRTKKILPLAVIGVVGFAGYKLLTK